MYLYKRKSGIYYVIYNQPNGKRTSLSTQTQYKKEALKFLTDFKSTLKERQEQKVTPITLKDFSLVFLKYSETIHTPKTTKAFTISFKFLQLYLGNIQLSELTRSQMESYFQHRISSSSIYSARKDLINLSSAFNKAVIDNYLITNPCKGIKRFKIPEKQPLFFRELEFEKLLSVIDDNDFKDLVLFAINTGLRQMELITLQFDQVELNDKLLILNNLNYTTKSKKIRTIPLNECAKGVIQKRMQDGVNTPLIFTRNGEAYKPDFVSHKFKYYVRKANLNDKYNFHSLRHTFASWLIQRGANIYYVSKLLGHSNLSVTEMYSHLRTDDLRESIELLD